MFLGNVIGEFCQRFTGPNADTAGHFDVLLQGLAYLVPHSSDITKAIQFQKRLIDGIAFDLRAKLLQNRQHTRTHVAIERVVRALNSHAMFCAKAFPLMHRRSHGNAQYLGLR